MRVILGSKSPRRKELMNMLNIKYDVMPSDAEEVLEDGLTIIEQSKHLAYIKAKDVFDKTQGDRIVIGSDTIVVKDDIIYGKPKDRDEAISMIEKINNTNHQVMTSLCIIVEKDKKVVEEYIDCDITDVYINKMTRKEIENWIDSGEAYDKAGAYAVQGKFIVYISRIEGDYASVMGLPINKVYNVLKKYELESR